MLCPPIRIGCALLAVASLLTAQKPVVVPPGFGPSADKLIAPQEPAKPAPAPAQPVAKPAPAKPITIPQSATPGGPPTGSLNLDNASLTAVIDILARQLGINYVLDPKVRGSVTLYTYGETKSIDTRSLLDLVLRINGFTMVQTGPVYRIVPLSEAGRQPLPVEQKGSKDIPDDDRVRLNLVFLKYVSADELSKLLDPFLSEGGKIYTYAPANLLLVLDSGRSMRRTMDLIAMFDSDTLTGQRVRLFDIKNGRPTDLAKELDRIFKGISLNEKVSSVKFLPLDRINTLIAIAPNPGVFQQVSTWLKKLDIVVAAPAGAVDNYVYRVKYGRAEFMGMAIMSLYMGGGMMGMMSMMSMMGGMNGGGMTAGGLSGMGAGMGGMYGGGMGGMYGGNMGGMYGGNMGSMYGGNMGGMYGGMGYNSNVNLGVPPLGNTSTPIPASGLGTAAAPGVAGDQTGSYLSGQQPGGSHARTPHIVPNPMDNTILIQATPEEYDSILRLLKQLDIPPRQVLIEAKIIEVSLTGAFASGVSAYLQKLGASGTGTSSIAHQLQASLIPPYTTLTAGILIGKSRELLGALSLSENASKTKTLSEPSVIATDSIPASINVGQEVPTLTAQAVTGVQQGGNSLFANSISNVSTGVTLNIMARVNPSGVVTMVINQEVSAPEAPSSTSAIQSPSFSKRTVQTQVTVEDGDTIAIGGIISETSGMDSSGIPLLHRLPVVGAAFGNRSYNRGRTELVIFLTPRVIYDTAQISDASEELKGKFKQMRRYSEQ